MKQKKWYSKVTVFNWLLIIYSILFILQVIADRMNDFRDGSILHGIIFILPIPILLIGGDILLRIYLKDIKSVNNIEFITAFIVHSFILVKIL